MSWCIRMKGVKLPFTMLASHMAQSQALVVPLTQLPTKMPWKAVEYGQETWMEFQTQFKTSPALVIATIWRVSQ